MSDVEWTQSAIDDIAGIREQLREISPEIAQDVIERLILSAKWLCEFPDAGPGVGYHDCRKWNPKRTGHTLIYRTGDPGISVIRVLHVRRDQAGELK